MVHWNSIAVAATQGNGLCHDPISVINLRNLVEITLRVLEKFGAAGSEYVQPLPFDFDAAGSCTERIDCSTLSVKNDELNISWAIVQ